MKKGTEINMVVLAFVIMLFLIPQVFANQLCLTLSKDFTSEDLEIMTDNQGYKTMVTNTMVINMVTNEIDGGWIANPQGRKSFYKDLLVSIINIHVNEAKQKKDISDYKAGLTVTMNVVNY